VHNKTESISRSGHRRQYSREETPTTDKLAATQKSECKTDRSHSRRNSIEDAVSQTSNNKSSHFDKSQKHFNKNPFHSLSASRKISEKQFNANTKVFEKTDLALTNKQTFKDYTIAKNSNGGQNQMNCLVIETDHTDKSMSQSQGAYSPKSCSANRKKDFVYTPMSTKAHKPIDSHSGEDKGSLFKKLYKGSIVKNHTDKEFAWDRNKAKSLVENNIFSNPMTFAYSKNMIFPKPAKDKGMGKRQQSLASGKTLAGQQVPSISLSALVGMQDKISMESSPFESRTPGRARMDPDNRKNSSSIGLANYYNG
jgi:hypothetical protein